MEKLSLFFLMVMLCASAPSGAAEFSDGDADREWREEQDRIALRWELRGSHFFDERKFEDAGKCFLKAQNGYFSADCLDDAKRLKDTRDFVREVQKRGREGRNSSISARRAETKERRIECYENALFYYTFADRIYRKGVYADKIAKIKQKLNEAQGKAIESDGANELAVQDAGLDVDALFTAEADGKNALIKRFLRDSGEVVDNARDHGNTKANEDISHFTCLLIKTEKNNA